MQASQRDVDDVTAQLGRPPRGEFEVVVRDEAGKPVVIKNQPWLRDGTPMPTLYWLTSPKLVHDVGLIESAGGVNQAEAEIDPDELRAAHARYAAERDALASQEIDGPSPYGGVAGTRTGVKCLHAHYAYFLAGGDDPVGQWTQQKLDEL